MLEVEYFMHTSKNLRNSDRNEGNPGMMSLRVLIRKTSFTQNKCSEAKILNDQQPEQSQYWILLAINWKRRQEHLNQRQ